MVKINEYLLINLRAEVRNYLRTGAPINRPDKFQYIIDQMMKEETECLNNEMYENEYRAQYDSMGLEMSFHDWLLIARALYTINADYSVTSIAKGPENAVTVECNSLKAAHKRIVKLIAAKKHDHFKRGYTFWYIPEHLKVG